jgi:hypothetical protein
MATGNRPPVLSHSVGSDQPGGIDLFLERAKCCVHLGADDAPCLGRVSQRERQAEQFMRANELGGRPQVHTRVTNFSYRVRQIGSTKVLTTAPCLAMMTDSSAAPMDMLSISGTAGPSEQHVVAPLQAAHFVVVEDQAPYPAILGKHSCLMLDRLCGQHAFDGGK